ncbi:hypothetical protein CEXT_120441 [Caerostris extrusa]|uniref:Uncharacterized protein n=1 Tax=Caerostris extrusa TaxID=172846 RepID=A0AAV4VVM6_CAEEX|nr:hypothetical protein CEXT_120441 [Caerostris extrusa]
MQNGKYHLRGKGKLDTLIKLLTLLFLVNQPYLRPEGINLEKERPISFSRLQNQMIGLLCGDNVLLRHSAGCPLILFRFVIQIRKENRWPLL